MIFKHELKHYLLMVFIWSLVISFFLVMVVSIFPMMAQDMSSIVGMINSLGPFSQALKIDGLMINQLIGFYAMELENVLGIAGGFLAGYLAIKILAKEEGDQTAEFLLTHPISRDTVYLQKFLALVVLVIFFNVLCTGAGMAAVIISGQSVPIADFFLIHGALLMVHLSLATLIYGMSAFLHGDSLGIGLGLVFVLYFVNLFINIYDKLDFLKYITPYQFAYAADILNGGLNLVLIAINVAISLVFFILGQSYYHQKDIHG